MCPGPAATCIFPEFGTKGGIKLSSVELTNEVLNSKHFVGSNNFDSAVSHLCHTAMDSNPNQTI